MRQSLLALLFSVGGCSLLFDPSGVVPAEKPRDLGVPSDLNSPSAVDDLSVVDDLAQSLPDMSSPDLKEPSDLRPLPDLRPVDLEPCSPPPFLGFVDGGSVSPLDCNNCGCSIDTLDNTTSIGKKFTHGNSLSFSESAVADGGLTITGTGANETANAGNGEYDYYQSINKFYLDGDFDLLLDFQIQTLPSGAHVQLYALGPPADMGLSFYSPEGIIQIYTDNAERLWLYSDGRVLQEDSKITSGTMRITRTGSNLCSTIIGQPTICHSGTAPERPYVQIEVVAADPACTTCFVNVKARFSKLRLAHGRLVQTP